MSKKTEETVFRVLMITATISIIAVLSLIIISVAVKAFPALSWDMISKTPKGGFYFGKEGGILNAITGSFYVATGATLFAFIIGAPVAFLINLHYIKQKAIINIIRFFLDIMWGVPSIVYGAFGFSIMIYFGLKTSLLAGIITVTLFIIPIMVRAMDEVLKEIPHNLLEASYSLGSTHSETALKIMFRQCVPGILTAILLSFGRAIGDAASVLFTCGFTDYIPHSLNDQVATLPLAIFFQLGSPVPEVQARAYASAFILTCIILIISLSARLLSKKYEKHKINF